MALPRLLKWILWAVATISSLLVVAALLLFLLLSLSGSKDEVARAGSPNGKFDAILLETNGGATTSFGYEVYVSQRGAKPSGTPPVFLYGAIRSQNAYGANLRWESDRLVVIEFLSADSSKINTPVMSVGGQSIQFALRAGVLDTNAPSGGMLFNLHGRN